MKLGRCVVLVIVVVVVVVVVAVVAAVVVAALVVAVLVVAALFIFFRKNTDIEMSIHVPPSDMPPPPRIRD